MAIWILVSDASRAILYATEKREDDWKVIGTYQHPESRLKNADLSPSEPGHSAKSKGGARHTVMEPDTSPKEAEAGHFVQELVDLLDAGTKQQSFDGLVLAAPPHFLGLLRHHLSAEAKKLLITSVDSDYTSVDAREVRSRLQDAVFGASDQ
jgi:protein required for attachment to host cells